MLELPARWGDPGEALREVDALLGAGPPTDVVLLPETSLTGYVSPDLDFDLSRFAEPIDGETSRALARLAREHQVHLFGPLVLEEDGDHYNATVGFTPEGELLATYRKRHPWYPEDWATPGREPYPLLDIAGARVTIACCFDVHFLARDGRAALDAADVLLFPSSWVEEVDSRPRRLRALARRHRLVVASANWGPGLLRVPGQGGSCIFDAEGNVVAKLPRGERRADAVVSCGEP